MVGGFVNRLMRNRRESGVICWRVCKTRQVGKNYGPIASAVVRAGGAATETALSFFFVEFAGSRPGVGSADAAVMSRSGAKVQRRRSSSSVCRAVLARRGGLSPTPCSPLSLVLPAGGTQLEAVPKPLVFWLANPATFCWRLAARRCCSS